MNWHAWLTSLLVVVALAACTQGARSQAGAQYAAYSPENNEISPSTAEATAAAEVCGWQLSG